MSAVIQGGPPNLESAPTRMPRIESKPAPRNENGLSPEAQNKSKQAADVLSTTGEVTPQRRLAERIPVLGGLFKPTEVQPETAAPGSWHAEQLAQKKANEAADVARVTGSQDTVNLSQVLTDKIQPISSDILEQRFAQARDAAEKRPPTYMEQEALKNAQAASQESGSSPTAVQTESSSAKSEPSQIRAKTQEVLSRLGERMQFTTVSAPSAENSGDRTDYVTIPSSPTPYQEPGLGAAVFGQSKKNSREQIAAAQRATQAVQDRIPTPQTEPAWVQAQREGKPYVAIPPSEQPYREASMGEALFGKKKGTLQEEAEAAKKKYEQTMKEEDEAWGEFNFPERPTMPSSPQMDTNSENARAERLQMRQELSKNRQEENNIRSGSTDTNSDSSLLEELNYPKVGESQQAFEQRVQQEQEDYSRLQAEAIARANAEWQKKHPGSTLPGQTADYQPPASVKPDRSRPITRRRSQPKAPDVTPQQPSRIGASIDNDTQTPDAQIDQADSQIDTDTQPTSEVEELNKKIEEKQAQIEKQQKAMEQVLKTLANVPEAQEAARKALEEMGIDTSNMAEAKKKKPNFLKLLATLLVGVTVVAGGGAISGMKTG